LNLGRLLRLGTLLTAALAAWALLLWLAFWLF
jgi:hypothetical protein